MNRSTVGITVPTGYSFNLDGTAIYLTMAALFIAEAMDKPFSLGEQVSLLVFMMIASKGAAGVTGAGLATLAGGLHTHRPDLVDGVGFIVGIDRMMSEARALTNFSGNAVATLLVGKWTRSLSTSARPARCCQARGPSTRRLSARKTVTTRTNWPSTCARTSIRRPPCESSATATPVASGGWHRAAVRDQGPAALLRGLRAISDASRGMTRARESRGGSGPARPLLQAGCGRSDGRARCWRCAPPCPAEQGLGEFADDGRNARAK